MTARAQKMSAARLQVERQMSEDDLLTAIVEAALFLGWQVMHVRRSDKALTMGTPGFPDLVLAKAGRVLFYELKAVKGRLTEDQWVWARAITGFGSGDHFHEVVRPSDLDDILQELAK